MYADLVMTKWENKEENDNEVACAVGLQVLWLEVENVQE